MIMNGINDLHCKGVEKNGETIKVNFVFSSDWKFLALLMGIRNASSTYFCPWCCCPRDLRNSLQIDWGEERFKRKWNDVKSMCFECKDDAKPCTRSNHGYRKDMNLLQPPFNENNVVLDTLHSVLRTSEILEKELKNRTQCHNLNTTLQQLANKSGMFLFRMFDSVNYICQKVFPYE